MATLSGTVRDNSGIAVPDATVSAFDQQNMLVSEDTTANEGADLGTYRLTKLTQGRTYVLHVAIGEATRTVGEVNVNSQSMTHDISLSDGSTSVTSATSATSVTSATSDTSSTSATDTSSTTASDTSSTTATDTSSTTSTDTSSTTSATSDSTTSATSDSSTSVTSGTSSTSTVSSDTSSSTTMTATSSVSVTATVTLDPGTEFSQLTALINDGAYAITPPVNIEEAKQARNLMTVGFYIRAGVPQAIANLNSVLSGNNTTRINLVNKAKLLNDEGTKIKSILDRRTENTDTENDVLVQVRKQFNQGLESAEDINRDFPTIYRRLVNLVADDLMGVTPQQLESSVVFDATQRERLFNHLRQVKASILAVTESLSFAGSLGTIGLTKKWSLILRDSLDIIRIVGDGYVASDNVDDRHWASVLSALVSRPVAENRPYLVHAREGGQLLSDVIQVYQKITQQDGLEKEDESFIRTLFYTSGDFVKPTNPPTPQTVAERLKENGRLLRDNWPTNFGA